MDWLTEKMREANFTVSSMHGDMPQKERESIMKEFRSGARWVSATSGPRPCPPASCLLGVGSPAGALGWGEPPSPRGRGSGRGSSLPSKEVFRWCFCVGVLAEYRCGRRACGVVPCSVYPGLLAGPAHAHF